MKALVKVKEEKEKSDEKDTKLIFKNDTAKIRSD